MTKPTDKELKKLAEESGIGWAAGLGGMDDFLRNFASAVLDRWGTPPQPASQPTTKICLLDEFEKVLDALKNWNNEDDLMWIQYREQVLRSAIAQERIAASTVQGPAAVVHECGNLYAKVKLCGEAFGTTKVGDRLYSAPVSPNDDADLLDWLAHAGPVSICMVIDRPHDGEYEVSTDYVTGYGETLREALRAAIVLQGEKLG